MNIQWDADRYAAQFSFVPQYGEALLELLDVPPGSFVVDLGCGSGALTGKLAAKGYRVLGVDASPEMLALARTNNPGLEFTLGDAASFLLSEKADAIFSNAVLHWIDGEQQPRLLANLAANLKPGGQLVFEMGGKGCAEAVHSALSGCFAARGLAYPRTFYFPTVGGYAPMLEACGLRVEFAALFPRPTAQSGPHGLRDWINMFDTKPFEGMDPAVKEGILKEAETLLRPTLWDGEQWVIDYVRLRMKARKAAD